jgi:uncharacterized protein (AIM24 family)
VQIVKVEGTVAHELTRVPGLKTRWLGGDGHWLVRLRGPGKVWLQSLSLPKLAEALQPYIVESGDGGSVTTGVETAAVAGTIAAAAKGLGGLFG